MRHDYDIPKDWNAMTDEEKSRWMTQERCRRLAGKVGTPVEQQRQNQKERIERRAEAQPGTVTLKDYR